MPNLNATHLEQLRQSRRMLLRLLLLGGALIVAGFVQMYRTDNELWAGAGATLFSILAGIGLAGNQRVMRELGITPDEAKAALALDKERRSGAVAAPLDVQARRGLIRANLYLAAGLVSLAVLVFAARFFFAHAGDTNEEGSSAPTWLGVSFFAGFISLILAPTFLIQAKVHREGAKMLRE